MSVFGHASGETAGTGGLRSGWNDQNARCSGLMTYAGAVAGAGVSGKAGPFGAAAAAGAAAVRAGVGHGAPAFTHSTSVSISSGRSRPPFGIFSFSLVCLTA